MAAKWSIRKAIPEDSTGLKNCMVSAYATYQERMSGERLPPMEVDYLSEIEAHPTWVVESDGVVIGGLIMVFEPNQALIANLSVAPGFQGEGIGGAILKWAETEARQKGYSEIRLATHILLTENISLYQYLGWKETGRDNVRVFMAKQV